MHKCRRQVATLSTLSEPRCIEALNGASRLNMPTADSVIGKVGIHDFQLGRHSSTRLPRLRWSERLCRTQLIPMRNRLRHSRVAKTRKCNKGIATVASKSFHSAFHDSTDMSTAPAANHIHPPVPRFTHPPLHQDSATDSAAACRSKVS